MCDFICANDVWDAYYAGAEFNFLKLVKYLWFWSQKKKNELNLKIVQISFDQKKVKNKQKNSGKKIKSKHQKRSEEISEEHFIHRTNIAPFCTYESYKLRW